jgi:hypothetical protein
MDRCGDNWRGSYFSSNSLKDDARSTLTNASISLGA